MNEADSPSINLDELRLLPDWMREEPLAPSKQYAGHEGRDDERRGPGGDRRGPGGPRRDNFGPRGGGGGGGPRPGGGGGQGRPGGGGDRRGPGPRGNDRGPRRDDRGDSRPQQAPLPPVTPAPVKIEFMPESRCLNGIVKQIRTTHMAYPLFGTARMFLQEPERHLLRVTVEPAASETGTVLYQLDEGGPIALNREVLERIAFEAMKDRFYVEQTVTKEPPKGNFTNVARCRLDGTLLGPTNYHGYQPALRSLYENKFSRRMPFEAFRQSIEVVSDPAMVEKWKGEANTVTTISTRTTAEGETPTVLQSNTEARAHFRQNYLEGLLRQAATFELPGSVARSLPEAGMMMSIRQSNENELRYPALFVQHLRKGLQDAGLHIFKHRKRIVYVAVTRPVPFSGGAISENVAAILEFIGQKPNCTRKDLANKFLGRYVQSVPTETTVSTPPVEASAPAPQDTAPAVSEPSAEESATDSAQEPVAATPQPEKQAPADPQVKGKAALASDLRFMVQAGHIIEFHNGTFDLPLSAKTKEDQQPAGRSLPKPNPLFSGKRKHEPAPGALAPAVSAMDEQAAASTVSATEEAPVTETAEGHQIVTEDPETDSPIERTEQAPENEPSPDEEPSPSTSELLPEAAPDHAPDEHQISHGAVEGPIYPSKSPDDDTAVLTGIDVHVEPAQDEAPPEEPVASHAHSGSEETPVVDGGGEEASSTAETPVPPAVQTEREEQKHEA